MQSYIFSLYLLASTSKWMPLIVISGPPDASLTLSPVMNFGSIFFFPKLKLATLIITNIGQLKTWILSGFYWVGKFDLNYEFEWLNDCHETEFNFSTQVASESLKKETRRRRNQLIQRLGSAWLTKSILILLFQSIAAYYNPIFSYFHSSKS